MKSNRILSGMLILMLWGALSPTPAAASPWAEQETYGQQVSGKFVFGLKHTLFSWMNPWAEAHDPKYPDRWTGFCAGLGKAFIYTGAGAVQLVTFPIPVDFPNIGLGMHIAANHPAKKAPASPETDSKDTAAAASTQAEASGNRAEPLPETLEGQPAINDSQAASESPAKKKQPLIEKEIIK